MSDQTGMRNIEISVPVLARVEGEGALDLHIRDGKIEKLHLKIFEPPRLFEKFLETRHYHDVPDMVARICGICPVAYQMSAVHAIEAAFDITISPWVRDLRRLIYCGEWLESHSLHMHLLAAPDFLGFSNVAEMAKQHPDVVTRGMMLQRIGNDIIRMLGGRSVHPVGVKVGGFYHAADKAQATSLLERIKQALPDAERLVRWSAGLDLPDEPQDFICIALQHPNEYAMNEGRLVSSHGLDIGVDAFDDYFKEHQAPYSTALHCLHQGKPYMVGPLARVNLNAHLLPESLRQLMTDVGFNPPGFNSFHSIIARAIEIYYALTEAQRILENYQIPQSSAVVVTPKAGVGYAATEAPRGMLWHRYEMNGEGRVISARIVPPTSQNQARIEDDLRYALNAATLNHDDETIRRYCEKIIRNYDPCISCSTHFLDLRIVRD